MEAKANLESAMTLPRHMVDSHSNKRPHIVMVIPRGEAVRNFLYSGTLRMLRESARVTLLSVVDDEALLSRYRPFTERIHVLRQYPQNRWVSYLRALTENAHDRWLWSAVAQNNWELRDRRAADARRMLQRTIIKAFSRVFGNNPSLHALTRLEQYLNWRFRPTREFDELFQKIKPDLVFNGSHIHGLAGELPLRVAKRMGIPTAGFIFSWDNLTSRSRIFVPYDHYLVWHEHMKEQLLRIYPRIQKDRVYVTGTPQFDFHVNRDFWLSREDLCQRIGIDPKRPFVLYTTGIMNHFFDEHHHVELVIRLLNEIDVRPKPQLVVRTYVKGTSSEMMALADRGYPDVVFRPGLWKKEWKTPLYEDLPIYTNLLRYTSLGINAASTVSLELLMFDKPAINLDFDPPGVQLPWCMGYSRHIHFDHYEPVANSGAVMVARSERDMRDMLLKGLNRGEEDAGKRQAFIRGMFGDTLDGNSGKRVAQTLLGLANSNLDRHGDVSINN
jgi:hypothetical protein